MNPLKFISKRGPTLQTAAQDHPDARTPLSARTPTRESNQVCPEPMGQTTHAPDKRATGNRQQRSRERRSPNQTRHEKLPSSTPAMPESSPPPPSDWGEIVRWMLFGNADAGWVSACIYTLVENCKRQGLNPETYIKEVLTHLPETRLQKKQPSLTPVNSCSIAAQQKIRIGELRDAYRRAANTSCKRVRSRKMKDLRTRLTNPLSRDI